VTGHLRIDGVLAQGSQEQRRHPQDHAHLRLCSQAS
jgi:hypothetical protein